MKQLLALSGFLIGLNLFDANDFDSWIDNSEFDTACKDLGAGGLEIARHTYTGVFYIERFAHKRHDPAILYAHLSAWLQVHDVDRFDRQDAKVKIDVALLDAETSEVTIEIDFAETITVKEDENGVISLDGKTYNVAPTEIWIAEEGEIVDDPY